MDVIRLLPWAIPLTILSIFAEHLFRPQAFRPVQPWRDVFRNILIGLGAIAFATIASLYTMRIYVSAYTAAMPFRTMWFGMEGMGWGPWAWLAALLLDDFMFYWYHRMAHRVRFMWASHVVHHSSTFFNLTTGARLAWFSALYKPFLWAWIPALGVHPLMVAACAALSSLYQFFCHTDYLPAWNRLSWLLVTPGLHAVHHARDEDCIDRNYAAIFSFFDRLFGSFTPYAAGRVFSFGVNHPPRNGRIPEILLHEFRRLFRDMRSCRRFSDKLRLLYKPPDWRPG